MIGRTLASQVRPKGSFLRAANLEHHHGQELNYIPTSRALEVLRRIADGMTEQNSGKSWSLTGPYGVGKSSFALFLRALLGPPGATRTAAEVALAAADPDLLRDFRMARETLGASRGFILATTTCQQEPVAESLLRALIKGAYNYWPKRKPAAVEASLREAASSKSARSIAMAAASIASFAPLLFVLDEFGKTLEYFSASAADGDSSSADLFVLQELAELAIGESGSPVFTFTLQHLAFDDYVMQASEQQRREWGKVQGRFEDIPFLESSEQSLRLVSGALDDNKMTPQFSARRRVWAEASIEFSREVGICSHIPGGVETIEKCYPLHPVALLVLPELCAKLGQHGRTLFTFLAGSEPGSTRHFLETTELPAAGSPLPTMKIKDLFDFFAGAGQSMALSVGGSRWREIYERVLGAGNLSEKENDALKTVGVLNLMGGALGLRASADLLTFALSSPERDHAFDWKGLLADLESRGFLTYRGFADEYRLWHGSDVDLRGRVNDAREQLSSINLAELVSRLQVDQPLIAGRHSQEVGMLRYFSVAYTDDSSREIPSLPRSDSADGLVVYHLGTEESATELRAGTDRRPVVLVLTERFAAVRHTAIEVAAALAVLDHPDVQNDWVARRELQDRVAEARNRLGQALARAFLAGSDSVTFRVWSNGKWNELKRIQGGMSRLLSDVCDRAYYQSPHIRNEMLGRRTLSSQGARARRQLIEAMIENSGLERLGLNGFGPERAMYEAVLRHTGIHALREGKWGFGTPALAGNVRDVWGAITIFVGGAKDEARGIDELYGRLMEPPIGLKEGPVPVLLVAHLLQRPDDVAIYEDGTFQPRLSADLVERLVKSPQRFSVKLFATDGSRSSILSTISTATRSAFPGLSGGGATPSLRNQSVLAAAAPLLTFARGLNLYSRKTTNISKEAREVRDYLLTAREPDELLFVNLPAACGFRGTRWRQPSPGTIQEFGNVLTRVLRELDGAFEDQLAEIRSLVAMEFHEPADVDMLRSALTRRASAVEERVTERNLNAFIFNVTDDSTDADSWVARIGLAVTGKSVEWWQDEDRREFGRRLREIAELFLRVEALHTDLGDRSLEPGQSARRVTFTSPDGAESTRLLFFDSRTDNPLRRLATQVMRAAEEQAGGPHGRAALVALMLEEMFDGPCVGVLEGELIEPRIGREEIEK